MTDGSIIEPGYYQIAWLIYAVAALGLLLAFWRLVRKIKARDVRWYLMTLLAVGMAVPSWEQGDEAYVAPAILVGAFDFLDGLDQNLAFAIESSLGSLWPIVAYIAFATVLLALWRIKKHFAA